MNSARSAGRIKPTHFPAAYPSSRCCPNPAAPIPYLLISGDSPEICHPMPKERIAMPMIEPSCRGRAAGLLARALLSFLLCAALAAPAVAAEEKTGTPTSTAPEKHTGGGEANLILPDLNSAEFLGGIGGKNLLFSGLVVSVIGLGFGLSVYSQLKNLPVHKSMLEVSELIYETCKTYLFTQGKFLFILWL